jgi:hypothetical protein
MVSIQSSRRFAKLSASTRMCFNPEPARIPAQNVSEESGSYGTVGERAREKKTADLL